MNDKIKVIFLGDSSVGKSCIISALNNFPINTVHQPTIGIDFYTKCCEIEDKEYKLQFWDTAGQEKFRSIMPSYVRNSHFIIIVFDVTNPKSYQNLPKWFEFLGNCSTPQAKKIVVGNKIDIEEERKVPEDEASSRAELEGMKYRQISAKTRVGVDDLLNQLLQQLKMMKRLDESKKAHSLQLSKKTLQLLKQACC